MDVSVIELMMFLVAAEASVSAEDVLNSLGEVPWILKRLEVSLRNGFSKLLVNADVELGLVLLSSKSGVLLSDLQPLAVS